MSGTAVPVCQRHRRAAHYGTAVPVSQCTLQVHIETQHRCWYALCVYAELGTAVLRYCGTAVLRYCGTAVLRQYLMGRSTDFVREIQAMGTLKRKT
jgi:hypothetical protein